MWCFELAAIFLVSPLTFASLASDGEDTLGEIREYCLSEKPFEANCPRNEVIVVNIANYGRMRIGRCLENEEDVSSLVKDPRLALGCSVDVLHIMDRRCSGRNQCLVGYTDEDLQKKRPCHKALKTYLEVDYNCLTVIESDRTCLTQVSSNPIHIMRSSAAKLGCGSKSQPWKMEAPAGQQINVSLLDFGSTTLLAESDMRQGQTDDPYGYIMDKSASSKNISIHRRHNERFHMIHISSSNILEIILSPFAQDDEDLSNFLLGFKAVGCSDLVPPDDTWLRRKNNEVTVGCYSSRQTWHLRCTDNKWIGVIGNCSREIVEQSIPKIQQESQMNLNQVLIISSIGVITLIICSIIICCGLVLLKRHYAISAHKQFQLLEKNEKYFQAADNQHRNAAVFVHSELPGTSA